MTLVKLRSRPAQPADDGAEDRAHAADDDYCEHDDDQ